MDKPNPYEPPQVPSNHVEPISTWQGTITLEFPNHHSFVAMDDNGETLFTFRRPSSLLLDIFSAFLALVTLILSAFFFAVFFGIMFDILHNAQDLLGNNFFLIGEVLAISVIIVLPFWVASYAFYAILYRFSFSTFAATNPHAPLFTVGYRFRRQYKTLDVLDRLNNKIAEIHSTTYGYQLKLTTAQPFSAIQLTQHKDFRCSLSAESPHSTSPTLLGEAQWQDRQLLFHSQLPSTLPQDSKLLALNLLAVAFINPAKSRLFLR